MNEGAQKLLTILRWSEKYTRTDMAYLAQGGFWLFLGRGAVFLISFLTMLAFANWLPQKSFGTYQYILALLGLAGISALPGINSSLIRSIAQKKEGTLRLAIKTKLKWGMLGTLGMIGGAGWYLYHDQILLATALLLGGIFLPFLRSFLLFEAYWNGKKRFDMKSAYDVATAALIALCVIPTIYLTNNIVIILLVMLVASVLSEGFFLWKTLKQTENADQDQKGIEFGKHLTVINAVSTAAEYLDKVILWKFLGPIQVALYIFGLSPVQKVLALNPIGALALPKISESGVRRSLVKKLMVAFMITVPAAIGIAALAPFVFDIILPQYTESVAYFQVFSILIALTPLSLLNTALVAGMHKKELYITNISDSFVKIGLYLVLIPYFGIWGAVTGLLGGEAVGNLLRLYFFVRITSAHKTT